MELLEHAENFVLGEQDLIALDDGFEQVMAEMTAMINHKSEKRLETEIKLDALGFVWEFDDIGTCNEREEALCFVKCELFQANHLGTCDLSPKAAINISDRQGGLHSKRWTNSHLPSQAQQQEIEMASKPHAVRMLRSDVPNFIAQMEITNPSVMINRQWETDGTLFNYSTSATHSSIPCGQLFSILSTMETLHYIKVVRVAQNELLDDNNV